ncbi:CHY zinc finger protein [Halobacillus dabanensis]|uniref:CHY zinc finger protein n=1 Tax=Halobacillus dabanensis TaxID=240302 RepID=UPI000945CF5F|nr:CHY zinc finger protein [Halobacillus dabanensis]
MKKSPSVKGVRVDEQTRCAHYHSDVDIIAIKFYCCQDYYACYYCHEAQTNHQPMKWPRKKWGEKAILCGNCQSELSIDEYMKSTQCPQCKHVFNEKCSLHYPLYFEM